MHFFAVVQWTESEVDTLRHWAQQEDCGTVFFYNTLTHVSTYDNPFAVAASPWEKIVDEGGVYYFNTVTQESQWEKPDGFVDPDDVDTAAKKKKKSAAEDDDHDPRDDWEEVHDYDAHYFYNRVTGETAWKLPDFNAAPAAAKPAAAAAAAAAAGASATSPAAGSSSASSPKGASPTSNKDRKKESKRARKEQKAAKKAAKKGSKGGGGGDEAVRYTVNPADNEQGEKDTYNFVYRIDPADHWEEITEFDSKFYQNRITGETHHEPVIPPEWHLLVEMGRHFFTNPDAGEEWVLQFAADTGKCWFSHHMGHKADQEYPPWIASDAEAAAVLRDEPWKVVWLKEAHRQYMRQQTE